MHMVQNIRVSAFQFFIFNCLDIFNYIISSQALIGNIRNATQQRYSSVVCITKSESSTNETNIICTGTLISMGHILTSAHCFNGVQESDIKVLLGSVHLNMASSQSIMWWITFNQWSTRMRMFMQFPTNDIAVIKLLEYITNEIITPARLSMLPINRLKGLTVKVAGCGISNTGTFPTTIQAAQLKIIKKSECETIAATITGHRETIEKRFLCSLAVPYTLMNKGDSGGPLFHKNSIVAVNIGEFPSLNGTFHENKVNYHLSIHHYRYFIQQSMTL